MMNLKDYQRETNRTRNLSQIDNVIELANYSLGLVCEAGEVGDVMKKLIFHQHSKEKCIPLIKEEMGDVLWYMANICNILELDLNDILSDNIDKLKKRYPNGFSVDKSINREE